MDEEQATHIRLFDISSRIGRLRYLAYGWGLGLTLMPFTLTALYLMLHGSLLQAETILLLLWIFSTPIHFTFVIRRLHDMGRTGWWCVLYALPIPYSSFRVLGTLQHTQYPSPLHWLVSLVLLAFFCVLVFVPGTQGANRFGLRPPLNSAGVIAVVWSILLLPIVIFIVVVAFISTVDVQKLHVKRAVEAARASVYPATRYYRQNHSWPVDLASIDGIHTTDPVIGSVATIQYPDGGYGMIVRLRYSGSVEVWTTDGGNTWHCGSALDAPLADQDLPEDCREEPPPTR
ncbi:MAG TPA: DUF805 domain-containing protein [Gammaproteobacteria bacterium]